MMILNSLPFLLVRAVLGVAFILHGAQKVFGVLGGSGLAKFTSYVGGMGFPAWMGYAAAYFELLGGLMILLGIFPRLGALLVIPVMLVAIVKVHWVNGYFIQNGGYEYALCLLVLSLAVALASPDAYVIYSDSALLRALGINN